jgi:hypothetical protein
MQDADTADMVGSSRLVNSTLVAKALGLVPAGPHQVERAFTAASVARARERDRNLRTQRKTA